MKFYYRAIISFDLTTHLLSSRTLIIYTPAEKKCTSGLTIFSALLSVIVSKFFHKDQQAEVAQIHFPMQDFL